MSMADIEADADIGEVSAGDHLDQLFRSAEIIWDVFHENAHTSGLAKARRCSIDCMAASNLCSLNDSLLLCRCVDQKRERQYFGNLERALDFIHGIDPLRTVWGSNVYRSAAGRPHS